MAPLIFAAIGAGLSYKFAQAIVDEEYEGTVAPIHVREKMIQNHVAWYGYYCPRCDKRRFDLEVDHKIPIARGGSNSWYNLQVLCGDCNRSKGATYSFLEGFQDRMK